MPNESEVSEVVFSDAENLPLVASLCRGKVVNRHARLRPGVPKARDMKEKNKGGRPRSSRVQKKSRAVTVRYSALQYDIVRHRARTAGFRTLTEYVREASVNAEVVQNFIQEHNAVFRDLSGLCNNLNQLTRLAHAQGLQSTERALSDLLPQVQTLITHLHKEMKRQKVL